jgi:uncharacterized protein with HEPN domain
MSEDAAKLALMLEHAHDAAAAVHGKDKKALDNDLLLIHALAQSLGAIGVKAEELSKPFKAQYQQTNWETMTSWRKFVLYKYAHDNEDVLWQAIEETLPSVITELRALVPPDEDED